MGPPKLFPTGALLNWMLYLQIILATALPFRAISLLHLVIPRGVPALTFMGIEFGLVSGMVAAESQLFKLGRRQSPKQPAAERTEK